MQLQHTDCTVDGCGRPHKARGYCNTHYVQTLRGVPLRQLRPARSTVRYFCTIEGCRRVHKARGYCSSHYIRFLSGREVDVNIPTRGKKTSRVCTVDGCTDVSRTKNMCWTHYQRFHKHGYNKYPDRKTEFKICRVSGCGGIVLAKDLCNKCYRRRSGWKAYGLDEHSYGEMLAEQNGGCAICHGVVTRPHPRSGRPQALCIDHCHQTNKVRGLLCDGCNRALGLFGDSVERLRAAANYVERGGFKSDGQAGRRCVTVMSD